ncbi:universal stress protein [Deinococcus planocerae]|uniref:universal stress protein n=1 Tax=Deinococcus planocerae TaxID=1737569 RepID=UPI000C7EC7E7
MSTHGRTGLAHLCLGSVAEAVLHRVKVPVLLVRAPARATGNRQPRRQEARS